MENIIDQESVSLASLWTTEFIWHLINFTLKLVWKTRRFLIQGIIIKTKLRSPTIDIVKRTVYHRQHAKIPDYSNIYKPPTTILKTPSPVSCSFLVIKSSTLHFTHPSLGGCQTNGWSMVSIGQEYDLWTRNQSCQILKACIRNLFASSISLCSKSSYSYYSKSPTI